MGQRRNLPRGPRALLAAAGLAIVALPVAVDAATAVQPPPDAPLADPYRDLLNALQPPAAVEETMATMVDRLIETLFASSDEVKALANGDAAVEARLRTAMRPPLLRQMARSRAELALEFERLFSDRLTPGEARANAAFWRSEVGREVLATQLGYVARDLPIEPLMSDAPVTAEQTRAESRAGAVRLRKSLSREKLASVAKFLASPAGRKMRSLLPEITAIQNKWDNYQPSERDTAELEAAILAALPSD